MAPYARMPFTKSFARGQGGMVLLQPLLLHSPIPASLRVVWPGFPYRWGFSRGDRAHPHPQAQDLRCRGGDSQHCPAKRRKPSLQGRQTFSIKEFSNKLFSPGSLSRGLGQAPARKQDLRSPNGVTTCKKTIKKTRPRAPLPLLYPHFERQHTLPSSLPTPASTTAPLPNSSQGTAEDLGHLQPPAGLGHAGPLLPLWDAQPSGEEAELPAHSQCGQQRLQTVTSPKAALPYRQVQNTFIVLTFPATAQGSLSKGHLR